MYAAISADIVSSSSLSKEAMVKLNESLKKCISTLENRFDGFWGRIVRGDSIECLMNRPEDALEVALILKTWVKAFGSNDMDSERKLGRYGLRLAIGIGVMKTIDRKLDMMDGEAIYRSGRGLDGLKGWSKYQMTISMSDKENETTLQVILQLVNQVLNMTTSRKCEVLCHRLLAGEAKEAANQMDITVSGLNQSLNDIGWISIEQALLYYKNKMSEIC